jgi:hypothetical protein
MMNPRTSKSGIASRVFAGLALGLCAVTAGYADIQVNVIPSLAPNAYGSPSWPGWTQNAVYAIQNGLTSYGNPNLPTYYNQVKDFTANQTIVTNFPSWMGEADPGSQFGAAFASELGNRMHFGLDIVATNGQTFDLNDVSFNSFSSPGAGLDYGWAAGPWTYSPWRIGITAGGAVYNNGEDGSLAVTRFIYIGSGNSYEADCSPCTAASQQAAIDAAAIAGGGYTYTGTYRVKDSSGRVFSGSGAFDVAPVPEPSGIILLVSMLGIFGFVQRKRFGLR